MKWWWTGSGIYVIWPLRVEWKSSVIVPLYNGEGERTKYKNYGGINFKCGWENICKDISNRICRVTDGLIGDEEWSFRNGVLIKFLLLRQIGEKA